MATQFSPRKNHTETDMGSAYVSTLEILTDRLLSEASEPHLDLGLRADAVNRGEAPRVRSRRSD